MRQAAQRAYKRARYGVGDSSGSDGGKDGSDSEFKLSGTDDEDDHEGESEISDQSSDFNPFDTDSDSDAGRFFYFLLLLLLYYFINKHFPIMYRSLGSSKKETKETKTQETFNSRQNKFIIS